MTTGYPLVLTRQYNYYAPKWLEVIKNGENLCILFFPKTDRLRRTQQLIDDIRIQKTILPKEIKYNFQLIDLNTVNTEDFFDLQDYLTRFMHYIHLVPSTHNFDECMQYLERHNQRLVLILHEAEKYLFPETKQIFGYISHLAAKYNPYVTIISLFELDIVHPQIMSLLPTSTNLYDNLFYYPLYNQEEGRIFLQYLGNKWTINFSKKDADAIIEKCGGHFWLIKEAAREIKDSDRWSIKSEGINFRLQSIFNSLLPCEQSMFTKILSGQHTLSLDERRSLKYMKKTNAIGDNNKCHIPLLQDYILHRNQSLSLLSFQNNQVLLNKIPIDKIFSRKESRVLKLLMEQKDKIVTREMIGERLWPQNKKESYSDWALDQIMARIRKRMTDLSLPSTLIQVVRGKGYKINPG